MAITGTSGHAPLNNEMMTFNKITGSAVGADLSALGEISHTPHQFVKLHKTRNSVIELY